MSTHTYPHKADEVAESLNETNLTAVFANNSWYYIFSYIDKEPFSIILLHWFVYDYKHGVVYCIKMEASLDTLSDTVVELLVIRHCFFLVLVHFFVVDFVVLIFCDSLQNTCKFYCTKKNSLYFVIIYSNVHFKTVRKKLECVVYVN